MRDCLWPIGQPSLEVGGLLIDMGTFMW
jgi:hypothetical protein